MKLTKSQREQLRQMFGGRCAYCGCELPANGWHADHVEAIRREWWKRDPKVSWKLVDGAPVRTEEKQVMGVERPQNDVLDNLFPSCAACNLYKHAMSLEEFRQQIGRQIEMLRDYSMNFRTAERYGLLMVKAEAPVVFYFETYAAEDSHAQTSQLAVVEGASR